MHLTMPLHGGGRRFGLVDLVSAVKTFVRIARTKSFSAVAAERGRTQPAISRQLASLEDQLQVRLFNRTTAGLSLTDDGRALLPIAQQLVSVAEELADAAGARHATIRGRIRLSVPTQFASFLSAQVDRFLATHPEVQLDLLLRDEPQDLVAEGIDLELRVGETADSSLMQRRLGTTTAFLVASPAYLSRAGEPRTPADLGGHACLTHARAGYHDVWWFLEEGRPRQVRVHGRLHAESAYAVRQATLSGVGLAVLSHLLVRDDIAQGRLVALMPDHPLVRFPISAVYPAQPTLSPRVRALLEFLVLLTSEDPDMA